MGELASKGGPPTQHNSQTGETSGLHIPGCLWRSSPENERGCCPHQPGGGNERGWAILRIMQDGWVVTGLIRPEIDPSVRWHVPRSRPRFMSWSNPPTSRAQEIVTAPVCARASRKETVQSKLFHLVGAETMDLCCVQSVCVLIQCEF